MSTKFGKLNLPAALPIGSFSCLFPLFRMQCAGFIGLIEAYWTINLGLSTISTFEIWQWKAGRNATVPLWYEKDRTIVWGYMHRIWDNMASQVVRIFKAFGKGSPKWTIGRCRHAALLSSRAGAVYPSKQH